MALRVGVIVEGQGDESAVPSLLERVWYGFLGSQEAIQVHSPPNRLSQGKLNTRDGLQGKVHEEAKWLLRRNDHFDRLILILIDAERHGRPCEQAPRLLGWACEARSDIPIACVMPNPMFETWFAAAAASLAGFNGLPANLAIPPDPEGARLGKGWVKTHLRPKAYKETVDQKKFVAQMDLAQCHANSRSFRKLCSELQRRLPPPPPAEPTVPDAGNPENPPD